MSNPAVLLSFDVEEFDLVKEHGGEISVKEGVKVSSEGLRKILDLLDETNAKATFFTTGNFAKTDPKLVLEILKRGHEVACHGVDHFSPKKGDATESKKILEKIIGEKVYGYRQPRMFKIDYGELKRAGYLYDSSVNPAFVPGRYNHLDIPRRLYKADGFPELPVSVANLFRAPLFWLALHLYPLPVYTALASGAARKTGYFATYFHPWEFADLTNYKEVPGYIKHNSGDKLVARLEKLINYLKSKNYDFLIYREFVEKSEKV